MLNNVFDDRGTSQQIVDNNSSQLASMFFWLLILKSKHSIF